MNDEIPEMVEAGLAVVRAAASRSIAIRLLGGVAIWLRGSEEARACLSRGYADLDFVAHKRDARALRDLMESLGFEPDQRFNAVHGAIRLLFYAPNGAYQVDFFLDKFEMSHKFDFSRRLEVEEETLPAAELLLTKLQVAELNRKDVSDVAFLTWSHELSDRDAPGQLSLRVVAEECAKDWGLFTTVTDNIGTTLSLLRELEMPRPARELVSQRLTAIRVALEEEPKTMGWKLRSRAGRRLAWHEVPEEVHR